MSARVLFALLGAALVSALAACAGGGSVERDSSARGIIVAKPSTGSPSGKFGTGATVYFYDDGSSSAAGPIVQREWNFDDGGGWTQARTFVLPHVFETKGNHKVLFRVTDSAGNTDTEHLMIQVKDKYDADYIFVVLGADEGDVDVPQADGSVLRYHQWRWRTISYDPENAREIDSPVLEVRKQLPPGDPDFDLLRIYSSGDPDFDFCGIEIGDGDATGDDLDGDGVDDDPSLERENAYWPHMHQFSGRCLGKSKEDVYVWKITSKNRRHELKGHVTLMK